MSESSPLRTALHRTLETQARERAATLGLDRYGIAALLYGTRTPTSEQAAEAQRYLDGGRSILAPNGLALLTALGAAALEPVWGAARLPGPPTQRRRRPVRRPAQGLQAQLAAAATARLAEIERTTEQLGRPVFGPASTGKALSATVTKYLRGRVSLLSAQGVRLLEELGLETLTVVWGARPKSARTPAR
ncbi:hypothetical protein [Deinococcus rufus]|uniref:Uncharacterized protein n=1 Tax=Deinococcus rufus TaxID=2136097 RepID=A0ABV7Z7V3_9DEIO